MELLLEDYQYQVTIRRNLKCRGRHHTCDSKNIKQVSPGNKILSPRPDALRRCWHDSGGRRAAFANAVTDLSLIPES